MELRDIRKRLRQFVKNEPVIVSAIVSVGAAAAAFGLPVTGVVAALLKVVGTAAGVASVVLARSKVTPVTKLPPPVSVEQIKSMVGDAVNKHVRETTDTLIDQQSNVHPLPTSRVWWNTDA